VGNLPREVGFPSPLSSLPSTFCVVDLRSLCLPNETATGAFSATEQRQRLAVVPTQKNIVRKAVDKQTVRERRSETEANREGI